MITILTAGPHSTLQTPCLQWLRLRPSSTIRRKALTSSTIDGQHNLWTPQENVCITFMINCSLSALHTAGSYPPYSTHSHAAFLPPSRTLGDQRPPFIGQCDYSHETLCRPTSTSHATKTTTLVKIPTCCWATGTRCAVL